MMPSLPNDPQRQLKRRANRLINRLNIGRFEGDFRLQWIGPNQFLYEPDNSSPFRFVRRDSQGQDIETIQPQRMETDGGSIPRVLQILPGLSPWEYGPAYMIHDWEFFAHHKAQRVASFRFNKSFKEVNLTLAEAIWTLMQAGYGNTEKPKARRLNVLNVYDGVMSPAGRDIWDG